MNLQSPELLINMKSLPDIQSAEYKFFWQNEVKKIREGTTINGFHFSPFLYWHLNLWSIYVDTLVNNRVLRKLDRPQFWDSFILIDDTITKAETNEDGKKGVAIVGSRRLSKSVIITSKVAHQAVAYQNTECLVSGGNQPDIKNLTDYIDLGLRNLPDYLRFSRVEDDWKKCVTFGFKEKGTNKRHEWSKIHVRNFDDGNNTEAAAGLTLSGFLLDEGGKFPFLSALAATTPCFDSPYGWRCSPIITATGGDMKKAGDMQELFNNPEAYNFLAVNAKEDGTSISLFIPGTQSLKVPREPKLLSHYLDVPEGSELDNVTLWVANEEKGKELILKSREQIRKSSGMEAYLKEVMYYPLTPEECFLDASENIFPVDLLQEQLSFLESGGYMKEVDYVELYRDINGVVKHKPTDKKPVTQYPAKPSDDNSGVVQVFEFPMSDAPYGLYTAGCLPPGEKVLTDKGMMNIEDITMSEKLISKDGKFVDIYSLERYYLENAPNFEVKVSNTFRTTTFTEEHPIFINTKPLKPYQINSNTEFDFKEVKHLKVKDWIKVPNFYRNNAVKEVDLDSYWNNDSVRVDHKVDSPLNNSEFWWLIGYYLGDGWVTGSKTAFAINVQETYYVEKLKALTEKYLERSSNNQRVRNNAVEYTINSEELADFLVFNFRKYADGKNIPEWVKYLPEEYKLELLGGYLASDGCVTSHTKGYGSTEFVSISLELLEAFQDILFSIGIVSNLSKLRSVGKTQFKDISYDTKECYHLRLGNGSTINLLEKIDDLLDPKIKRLDLDKLKTFGKQKRSGCFMSEDLSYIYFQVTEINVELFTGIVYNFHCETNTFMCHHITTHNTDPYKQSQAHYSTSLGATYIFKRIHNLTGERFQNMLVASYVGRPKKIQTWYEETRKLLEFYNAKTLCENMDMGFIDHCIEKKDPDKYLEKTPSILREDIHANTKVNRTYGIHTSSGIKDYINSLIIEYLQETIEVKTDEEGNHRQVLGVSRILDPMLIKELLRYHPKANADRKDAFGYSLLMAKNLNRTVMVSSERDNRYESYNNIAKKKNNLFSASRTPFTQFK